MTLLRRPFPPTVWLDSRRHDVDPSALRATYATLADQPLPSGWQWRWTLPSVAEGAVADLCDDPRVSVAPGGPRGWVMRVPVVPGTLMRDRALDVLTDMHLDRPDASVLHTLHGTVGHAGTVMSVTAYVDQASGEPGAAHVETLLLPR